MKTQSVVHLGLCGGGGGGGGGERGREREGEKQTDRTDRQRDRIFYSLCYMNDLVCLQVLQDDKDDSEVMHDYMVACTHGQRQDC